MDTKTVIENTIRNHHDDRLIYCGEADWLLVDITPEGVPFAVVYDNPADGQEDAVRVVSLWQLNMKFACYDADSDVAWIPDDVITDEDTSWTPRGRGVPTIRGRGPTAICIRDASMRLSAELIRALPAPRTPYSTAG
jgi:hypothetical protein